MTTSKTLQKLIIATAGCLISAFIIEKVTLGILSPTADVNAEAYRILLQGWRSQNYRVLKNCADQSAQMATDKELKDLSEHLSRASDLRIQIHIENFAESDSFSGSVKSFLAGALDPSKSIQAASILFEQWMIDPDELGRRVDARYQPVFRQYASAVSTSRMAFWLSLIGLGLLSWRLIKGAPSASPAAATNSSTQPSSIVTCPSCGTRNRSRSLQRGQSMVCGQCKTVLSTST